MEHIGEYKLLDIVGEGAYGQVWKAQHEMLRNTVAVKLLKDDQDLAGLVNEGEVLHRMAHDNIVHIKGGSLRHTPPYIVMEFVDGGSLKSLLQDKGKLEVDEALRIFRDIVAGIAYSHAEGFIHRDIKPDNVLFSEDSVVKICDFGLGRAVEDSSFQLSLRSDEKGSLIGTLAVGAYFSTVAGQPNNCQVLITGAL